MLYGIPRHAHVEWKPAPSAIDARTHGDTGQQRQHGQHRRAVEHERHVEAPGAQTPRHARRRGRPEPSNANRLQVEQAIQIGIVQQRGTRPAAHAGHEVRPGIGAPQGCEQRRGQQHVAEAAALEHDQAARRHGQRRGLLHHVEDAL